MIVTADAGKARPEKLAVAVRERRAVLGGLTQAEIAERGGPSTETLRLIENAHRKGYGQRTLERLDVGLGWPFGTAERILHDEIEADELAHIQRTITGSFSASMPPATMSVTARLGGPFGDPRGTSPTGTAIEKGAVLRHAAEQVGRGWGGAPAGSAVSAVMTGPGDMKGMGGLTVADIIGSQPDRVGALAAGVANVAALLAERAGISETFFNAVHAALETFSAPATTAAVHSAAEALRRFADSAVAPPIVVPPVVDVSSVFASLSITSELTAFAVPSLPAGVADAVAEFEAAANDMQKQPWFNENAPWRELLARYRFEQEHGPLEAVPAPVKKSGAAAAPLEMKAVADSGRGTDSSAVTVIPAERREEVLDVLEPDEILPANWSFVIAGQRDLADVDDLSLTNELFDRVRRRRPSPQRDEQLRAVHSLIGELLDEHRQLPVRAQRELN